MLENMAEDIVPLWGLFTYYCPKLGQRVLQSGV